MTTRRRAARSDVGRTSRAVGLARAIPSRVRWTPGGISSDIDDARGSSGGFGGFGLGGGSLGCGGVILLLVLSLLFHRNFFALFDNSQAPAPRQQMNQPDRKSTRLNSSHIPLSRMPSSA